MYFWRTIEHSNDFWPVFKSDLAVENHQNPWDICLRKALELLILEFFLFRILKGANKVSSVY